MSVRVAITISSRSMKQNIVDMKYALVNGERQEAQPGLTGKCELHGCPVIVKCGLGKKRNHV
jgi:hypothetical protein